MLTQVELVTFTSNLYNRLRTLYAQLFRLTLAPPVLPRLLAQSLPVLLLLLTSIHTTLNLMNLLTDDSDLQP